MQRLAEEGLHDRIEQTLLELLGPTYPTTLPSTEDAQHGVRSSLIYRKDGLWEDRVAGLEKRKLLREVLEVTGKFRELQAMNVQYDAALRELGQNDGMVID